MAFIFGGTSGGVFVASVVSEEVYNPVFDTPLDSEFIYQILPSFYRNVMSDTELFTSLWSGAMQVVTADFLNLWQIDYAKSLRDIPTLPQRKWVEFELYREVGFDADPDLTRAGIPGVFVYDEDALALRGSPENRARHDKNIVPLKGSVDEDTSLAWEVEVSVQSCQVLGGVLFGYFSSTSDRLTNSITIGVLGSESSSNAPRPFILHTSPDGVGSAAVSSSALAIDEEYRLSATYTAGTGIAVLTVTQLRYERLTGTSGSTQNDLSAVYTNVFTDEDVNFDTSGVVPGDVLIALDQEFEIVSVDGSELVVKPVFLPIDLQGIEYSIVGEQDISSLSLNLPADAVDPTFTADQFGVGSFDIGAISPTYVVASGTARRKSVSFTTQSWRFLDPTVEETILSLPRLQDTIVEPSELLYEGTDYAVDGSTIRFQEPPLRTYWAEYVSFDEDYIYDNFGANVDLREASSDAYKAKVRGLYYAYFSGPTIAAIQRGVHILVGLPIAERAGTVEAVNPAYSGTLGLITVAGEDYLYPAAVGTSLQVGDSVDLFDPLSNGVEVVDYISDPHWFVGRSDFNEMSKYHSFQVQLNIDAFDIDTLAFASEFVDTIRASWTGAFFQVYKELEDEIELDDELTIALTLELADAPYDTPVVAYDDAQFGGYNVVDWNYDQGLDDWDGTSAAMQGTGTEFAGLVTLTNGSATATGSGTSFLAMLGGPGAVTDRRVAFAVYLSSSSLHTTAGSNTITDAGADFLASGREVRQGDLIEISGDGTFRVVTVVSATELTIDAPCSNTTTSGSYTITGRYLVWCSVPSTTSNTQLTLGTVFPGTTGLYKALLINNLYFNVYYDNFEELAPEENLEFRLTLDPAYVGALPLDAQLPDTRTSTVTVTFNAAGETKTSTVAELSP